MSSRVSISPSALCMYMLWKDTFCSAPAALLYLRLNPVRIAYPCVKPSSCVIIRSTYFQYCSSPAGGFSMTHSHVPMQTNHLVDVRNLTVDVRVNSLRHGLSLEVDRSDVADVLPDALRIQISLQIARM